MAREINLGGDGRFAGREALRREPLISLENPGPMVPTEIGRGGTKDTIRALTTSVVIGERMGVRASPADVSRVPQKPSSLSGILRDSYPFVSL